MSRFFRSQVNELRRVCARQRRQLEEMAGELEHANRRIDQYEAEVRKLRARIDILKRDLTLVENEVSVSRKAASRKNANRWSSRACGWVLKSRSRD